MESVELRFDTTPVPASRPRVARNGAVFYPKAHQVYHQYLKNALLQSPAFKGEGLLEVKMLFVMPPYKTSSYPTHRSDLDNLVKLPLDCLTQSVEREQDGVITARYWDDDSLVAVLQAFKRFARDGEEPHTRIKIKEVLGDISEYVDRKFEE